MCVTVCGCVLDWFGLVRVNARASLAPLVRLGREHFRQLLVLQAALEELVLRQLAVVVLVHFREDALRTVLGGVGGPIRRARAQHVVDSLRVCECVRVCRGELRAVLILHLEWNVSDDRAGPVSAPLSIAVFYLHDFCHLGDVDDAVAVHIVHAERPLEFLLGRAAGGDVYGQQKFLRRENTIFRCTLQYKMLHEKEPFTLCRVLVFNFAHRITRATRKTENERACDTHRT